MAKRKTTKKKSAKKRSKKGSRKKVTTRTVTTRTTTTVQNPDYWTFPPKVKAIRKAIYAPNASGMGYTEHSVKDGDLIVYREYYTGGGTGTRLARVLGLATHGPDGKAFGKKKVLLVLAASDSFTFGYERFVDLEDVLEIRRPGQHNLGVFANWFFTGKMASPAETLRTVQYGAMKDSYLGEYLKSGKLVFDKKRGYKSNTSKKTNPKNPKVSVRSLVAKALK